MGFGLAALKGIYRYFNIRETYINEHKFDSLKLKGKWKLCLYRRQKTTMQFCD